jgi:hypothetical protein
LHAWIEGAQRARACLKRARGEIERDAGGMDGEEGGRAGIYGRREMQRGSTTRAFPDRVAAKPEGADTATEIIDKTLKLYIYIYILLIYFFRTSLLSIHFIMH